MYSRQEVSATVPFGGGYFAFHDLSRPRGTDGSGAGVPQIKKHYVSAWIFPFPTSPMLQSLSVLSQNIDHAMVLPPLPAKMYWPRLHFSSQPAWDAFHETAVVRVPLLDLNLGPSRPAILGSQLLLSQLPEYDSPVRGTCFTCPAQHPSLRLTLTPVHPPFFLT